jgi:hypothetical protein
MSNDFHAVKALRRGECGPFWGGERALAPTWGLPAGHHEEYAASVLRAFSPLGPGLLALACQWPTSSASPSGAPTSTSSAPASDPCAEPSLPSEPPRPEGDGTSTVSFALRPAGAEARELPSHSGGWCLDRWAPVSSYGEGASQPLERACERVLGPGCREDERAGLRRVLQFHYVQREDAARAVDGVLSRFHDALGAYAHFTRALLGDGDPAELQATPLERGTLVQRSDGAFAWRGRDVLWLRQVDERQPLAERAAAARALLPPLAREILAGLGESEALPAVVQQLPERERLPLGVRLLLSEAFGVSGLGPSAQGYYQAGGKRWRVATLVRADAEAAESVLTALEQQPDAQRLEAAPIAALQLNERRSGVSAPLSWVIGRRGEVVFGVGDAEPSSSASAADGPLTVQEKLSKLAGAGVR